MQKHLLAIFIIFPIILSLMQIPFSQAAPYTEITAKTAYHAIASGVCPNLVILDVRTREEFDSGHIRNALLIPHDELEQRLGELSEHLNHEIIVYCYCGMRSTIACTILDAHGFKKVYNMVEGMNGWMGQGYPTTTSYSTQVFFNLNPNPVKIGQDVLLKGILTDQFSSPVTNQKVKLYYRELYESTRVLCNNSDWRFALAINTNTNGGFAAIGKLGAPGFYEVCVYYAGSQAYEASYSKTVLFVFK